VHAVQLLQRCKQIFCLLLLSLLLLHSPWLLLL
jgi:hypothetical protein